MDVVSPAEYPFAVEAWVNPALLRQCLSKCDPGVAEWALVASAARCDDEPIQLTIMPFVTTRELFAISGMGRRQSYIGVLLESFRDSCDQLGTNWEDPMVLPNFPKLIENALSAGFRPSSEDLEFVEVFNLLSVSELFGRYANGSN
jgi:hypothetical protein